MDTAKLNFNLEQLLDIASPSDVQISPDGQFAAFVLGKANKPDKDVPFHKAIYLVDIETGETRPLTGKATLTNESPCWSPDGRWLAFTSNRANRDETQLYLLDMHGGEAQALTDLRGNVLTPKWSPDGCSIAFLCSGTDEREKRPDPDPIVHDAEPRFNRIWVLNRDTNNLRAITPETCHVFEYAWSPDSSSLTIITSPHPNPYEGWYSAQLHTVQIASGEVRQVCTTKHQIGRPTWSVDGSAIAFVSGVMSDEGNVSGEVFVVPAGGGEPRCVTPTIDLSITWIEWRDRGVLFGARQIDSTVLGWLDPVSGTTRPISKGMYGINGFGPQQVHVARNDTFVAVRESFMEPPNVYLGSLDTGEWRQLTHLPIDLAAFPPLHVENAYWRGPDGTPVHGFLIYPADYVPGKRFPLFLHVHGGPSWSYVPRYLNPWERLMLARGCLVLMPNPRGSWGRGHDYQSANVGDLGGGDWQDCNAGVDYLIERGLADPERLVVGGWSYGGYLAAWAITQTDRFRCAIVGASITNYESNYGVVSNREWQTTMFGSNVYDDVELHRSRSPMTYVRRVKTPALIVHGERDIYAPPEQALEFYIALKHFGVPTQLVIYPREPHGFTEQAHQIDLYRRIGAWVDRYLFDGEP